MLKYGRGVCYSGYRDGQSPINHTYPTDQEVLEDLLILQPHFDYLRMYDISHHAQSVLRVIQKHKLPFKVMVGVEPHGEISNPNCPWGGLHSDAEITENKVKNYEQLDRMATLCHEYPDLILAASVGNESTSSWHSNLMDPATIAAHVRYLKARIKQPVTFCEGAYYWYTKNAEAAAEVDFICIHSYPLWAKIPLAKALETNQFDYDQNVKAFPGKQILFTEFGWTTKSDDKMNQEDTNEIAQDAYLTQVEAWAKQNKIIMFLFEAFDEPWKGSNNPIEPEKHWGVYNVDRTPKLHYRLQSSNRK